MKCRFDTGNKDVGSPNLPDINWKPDNSKDQELGRNQKDLPTITDNRGFNELPAKDFERLDPDKKPVLIDDRGTIITDEHGALKPRDIYTLFGILYETDDNGKEYRVDGEFVPDNVFLLDGIECETDDNGNVYIKDGKPLPNTIYVLDGVAYQTDDNGNVYMKDGKPLSNTTYVLDGVKYRTDDNGDVYMKDGKPLPNTTYVLDGHTMGTNEKGDVSTFDGKAVKDLSSQEFNALQKTQIAEGLKRLAQGEELSTREKGNLVEMMMDQYFIANGYTPLHTPRVNSLNDSKEGHQTGIDGVYEKDGKYVIADAKYFSAQLNPSTKDGPQMSDTWIDSRLDECVGKEKADAIREAELDGNVSHEVFHADRVDGTGTAVCDTRHVDSDGHKDGDATVVCTFQPDGTVEVLSQKEDNNDA